MSAAAAVWGVGLRLGPALVSVIAMTGAGAVVDAGARGADARLGGLAQRLGPVNGGVGGDGVAHQGGGFSPGRGGGGRGRQGFRNNSNKGGRRQSRQNRFRGEDDECWEDDYVAGGTGLDDSAVEKGVAVEVVPVPVQFQPVAPPSQVGARTNSKAEVVVPPAAADVVQSILGGGGPSAATSAAAAPVEVKVDTGVYRGTFVGGNILRT